MQDFTGVPCVVDLVAMRDAITRLGGDPQTASTRWSHGARHRPLGHRRRLRPPGRLPGQRRPGVRAQSERYQLLRWAQQAFADFRSCRRTPGSVTRSTWSTCPGSSSPARAGRAGRLPRHLGRHGLPHPHGQRPRRTRLGGGRHRSRGGHARPADEHAHAAGAGDQVDR